MTLILIVAAATPALGDEVADWRLGPKIGRIILWSLT